MVRFKNRWLLVELLFPGQYSSNIPNIDALPSHTIPEVVAYGMDVDDEDLDTSKNDDPEDPDDPTLLPLSFYTSASSALLPPFLTPSKPIILSSGHVKPVTATSSTPGAVVQNNQIWQALRDSVIDVCGDVGWGKVASNMQVKYYSPTTSLCIIRVAREHIRTAWTGLSFVNTIAGQSVVPRVVAVSGTIKKLHFSAIRYSREITGLYLSHALKTIESDSLRRAEVQAWKSRREQVETELLALDDT
ncbi:hypothetical protein QFC21_002871 [Naganishia friedmannii]|uniref:Uncharacterized protein n=1 Tax=Naganishia friedmannii TaxID=89922 RepID=A0ACC2VTN5_9TREE|nr:hypothetical protein QFC21_002871 [Naganishia friedmannii]